MNSTATDNELDQIPEKEIELVLDVEHPLKWVEDAAKEYPIKERGLTAPTYRYAGPGNTVHDPEHATNLVDLVAWCHDLDYWWFEEAFGRPGIHNENISDVKMDTMVKYLSSLGLTTTVGDTMGWIIGGPKTWYSQMNDWYNNEKPIPDEWNEAKQSWMNQQMDKLHVSGPGRAIMEGWMNWDPKNKTETEMLAARMVKFMEDKQLRRHNTSPEGRTHQRMLDTSSRRQGQNRLSPLGVDRFAAGSVTGKDLGIFGPMVMPIEDHYHRTWKDRKKQKSKRGTKRKLSDFLE